LWISARDEEVESHLGSTKEDAKNIWDQSIRILEGKEIYHCIKGGYHASYGLQQREILHGLGPPNFLESNKWPNKEQYVDEDSELPPPAP